MWITRKINNSVALVKDRDGRDLVVFGRGVGFPAIPYELTDLSMIQRTFYDVNESYVELAASLPEDLIILASNIVEVAQCEIDCPLNPNLPITLADHLNFTIERFQNGLELDSPLAYDVVHFYPIEAGLGRQALKIIREQKGILLPEIEAVNIALHLVNGEMKSSDMHATLAATRVVSDVTRIIEDTLSIQVDASGFNYSRFVMHLRYLLKRIELDAQEVNGMSAVMRSLAMQYPKVYHCTKRVVEYLFSACQVRCNEDETLYIFMHINRINETERLE